MRLTRALRLYAYDEVPEHFQESFILSGYRSPRSSIGQCIISIFQPTNETLNVWTHLIPAIYFGWKVVVFWQNLDELSLPYMAPLALYMATMFGFPSASMLAHVFNALSDKARHICFFVDYWALSIFAFSSAIAFRAYSFTESQLRSVWIDFYIPCAALFCCGSLVVSCQTRFMKVGNRRKVVRFTSFAVPYFYNVMPLLHRLLFDSDGSTQDANSFHAWQFLFAFLSAFLYCSHIPERLFPGKFDIVGHSHQLFHVVSAFCSHNLLLALNQDAASKQRISENSYYVYLPLVAIVFVVNTIVVLYHVTYFEYFCRPQGDSLFCNSDAKKNDVLESDVHED